MDDKFKANLNQNKPKKGAQPGNYRLIICLRMIQKRVEKKLDGNYTRMLRAILNKSWRQHPKKHQLYGHLPSITKTIQVTRTRHAGHCRRSRDEIISDVLLWTPTYGRAKAGRPARTYIQQLCEDTGCSPEDLPEAMNYREKWRESVRDIRVGGDDDDDDDQKILTVQIRQEIYYSFVCHELFPEEQKGYWKGTRLINVLLYTDQHVLKKSKKGRKNVAIAWIDNTKASKLRERNV